MTVRFLVATRDLIASGARRMLRAWLWVALQFVGIALLIAVGLVWTRVPEKNAWQVILTLLIPLLVAAGFLTLQAGFLRALLRPAAPASEFAQDDAPFALGALTLLVWIAIGWVLWSLLDSFDGNTSEWASYLNSRFNAEARGRVFTYEHLQKWLDYVGWFLRWVVVPGLLIPLGGTALFGLRRAPWNRIARVWINWRWWPVVLVLALVGEAWPQTFFDANPAGPVNAQIGRVILKLIAAYLLAVLCWTKALVWAAALLIGPPGTVSAESAGAAPESNLLEGRPLPLGDTGDDMRGNA